MYKIGGAAFLLVGDFEMRKLAPAVALATFFALSGSANSAVLIQNENTTFLPGEGTMVNTLPNGIGSLPVVQIIAGSSGSARSPYEDSDGSIRAGYSDELYTSVQANGVGVWNVGASNTLQFLWGSPDSYNHLDFFSGLDGTGALLGSIIGTNLLLATTGLNHDWVTLFVTGGLFQSIKLTSPGQNAFEFTSLLNSCVDCPNNAPEPTPIPGAAFLMGSILAGGVGGMQIMRRRRKTA